MRIVTDFAASDPPAPLGARFLRRVLVGAVGIAVLSAVISVGGRYAGHWVSLGGYSDDAAPFEIVIGNNVLAVPGNMIRDAHMRRDGETARLDLYARWPGMDGFSEAARDDFNNKDGARRILFLSFEAQAMSRDMTGRLEPIYRTLIEGPGRPGPGGTTVYDFKPGSGYVNETLVVGSQPGREPFVARCLAGESASLAPCERDIALGHKLSLVYRFPETLLADWPRLEGMVRDLAGALIRTDG